LFESDDRGRAGAHLPFRSEAAMIDHFHFSLGSFHCTSLLDGCYTYPVRNIYASPPIAEVEEALRARGLPLETVTTPYTYLAVDSGAQRVMVDVGAGSLGDSTGRLMESIAAAQIDPLAIDTVVISHAHPDHIGGMLNAQGQLNFPNAQYFIYQEEWDFWFSAGAASRVPPIFIQFAHRALEAIREQVVLVSGDCEIRPGVRMLPAPGHTPGHAGVCFTSGGSTLAYIADTVIQPLHLEQPGWLSIYDILPDQAARSKHQVFDQAAAENWLVLGQHFSPFPSLGRVTKRETGWKWTPEIL
jgi:glyoxylase-like metal-dependent hydrolase (beta-lactamase superfamily II)